MSLELLTPTRILIPGTGVDDELTFKTDAFVMYAKIVYSKLVDGNPSVDLFDQAVSDGRIIIERL